MPEIPAAVDEYRYSLDVVETMLVKIIQKRQAGS
jgi:hypothetical protein